MRAIFLFVLSSVTMCLFLLGVYKLHFDNGTETQGLESKRKVLSVEIESIEWKDKLRDEAEDLNPTLVIAIISNNRYEPLVRLCKSLLMGDYSERGFFFHSGIELIFNLESASSKKLVQFASAFSWPYGSKIIRKRFTQGGLIRAVSESWYPSSPSEYGLLLEDDLELSPQYLNWINKVMIQRAKSHIFVSRMVGISLYSPRVTESVFPKRVFDSNNITFSLTGMEEMPYFMQTPCSWGALYFPDWWMTFLDYLRARVYNEDLNPHEIVEVPRSRTNGWKMSWKKYMFELMHIRGSFLLYPNFLFQESFSTNHMEQGEHIRISGVKTPANKLHYNVPLLQSRRKLDALALSLQCLPVLDCFGSPLSTELEMTNLKKSKIPDPPQGADIMNQFQILDTNGPKSHMQTSSTSDGASTIVHRANLQSDGQFVVYRTEMGLSMSPIPVWASGSYRGNTPGYRYVLRLDSRFGSVILDEICPNNTQTAIFMTPLDRYRHPSSVYHLRLETTGILVLYRDIHTCSRKSIVWMSKISGIDTKSPIWPPPRCISPAPSLERSARCAKFPLSLNKLLKADGLTLFIEFRSNFNILQKQLLYYSAIPVVNTIVVTWQNFRVDPPKHGMINNTVVRFFRSDFFSMNTRYTPLMYVTTEAVLTIRDDMKIQAQDVSSMFYLWKQHKSKFIGISPYWVHEGDKNKVSISSEDPPYMNGVPDLKSPSRKGFDLLTAGGLIFTKEYLHIYTCGSPNAGSNFERFRQKVLEYIESDRENYLCQDIGLYVVLAAFAITQRDFTSAIFLKPTYKVAHFDGHDEVNRASLYCIDNLVAEFKKVFGISLPVQEDVYAPNMKNKHVILEKIPYDGNRLRTGTMCTKSDHGATCSWSTPITPDIVSVTA